MQCTDPSALLFLLSSPPFFDAFFPVETCLSQVTLSDKLHYSVNNTFLYGGYGDTGENGSKCCVMQ